MKYWLVLELSEGLNGLHAASVVPFAEWQIDTARAEKTPDAVLSGLTVDVAAIVGVDVERDERLAVVSCALLEEAVEQLLPRGGMHARRPRQHSVEIEQERIPVAREERKGRRRVGHER